MTTRRIAVLLPLCAALAAACGGNGRTAAAAADTPAARRVWTPDQARALRQARERGEAAPAPAAVVPAPGPTEEEDSVRWAAEEKTKYDQRVQSMGAYADCMEKARRDHTPLQPTLEAACKRLPSAPR